MSAATAAALSIPPVRRFQPRAEIPAPRVSSARHRTFIRAPKSYVGAGPVDNYTRIPHTFCKLIKKKLSGGCEIALMLYIGLRTWGDPDLDAQGFKAEWALISVNDFAREIGYSTAQIEEALADLCQAEEINPEGRGLIERRKRGRAFEYRLRPDNWKEAADYEAYEPKAAKEEPAAASDEEEEPAAASAPIAKPVAVKTGARSRCIPFAVRVKDIPAPVPLKIDFSHDSPTTALFSTSVADGGHISVFVRFGELPANQNLPTAPGRFKQRSVDSSILSTYRDYFTPIFIGELKKPLDAGMLRQIVDAAAGAPPSDFGPALEKLRKKKLIGSGMILKVAREEVGPAFAQLRAIEEGHERDLARQQSQAAAMAYDWPADGGDPRWQAIRMAVKAQISDVSYANWLKNTQCEGLSTKGTLLVSVSDQNTAEILTEEYARLIMQAAGALNQGVERIQYRVLNRS